MHVIVVLEQLLEQLQRFLKLMDGENLSGSATVQKSLLTDLLHSYTSSNGTSYQHYTCRLQYYVIMLFSSCPLWYFCIGRSVRAMLLFQKEKRSESEQFVV